MRVCKALVRMHILLTTPCYQTCWDPPLVWLVGVVVRRYIDFLIIITLSFSLLHLYYIDLLHYNDIILLNIAVVAIVLHYSSNM